VRNSKSTTKRKVVSTAKRKATIALPRYYSGLSFKKLRRELGLTQKEMAKTLKLSVYSVSKFENQGRQKVVFAVDTEKRVNRLWRKNKAR